MAKQIPLNEVQSGRSVNDILAEIKGLYFKTTAATIERDFDNAIDLLKSIPLPEDRQRATVYMEGLAEMRREWKRKKKTTARRGGRRTT
jgi:hypothetical protein